jgi:hypothetical protein
MLDVYIWLGQRFDSFIDLKLAIEESKVICQLVDEGLRSLGPSKRPRKKRKKKSDGKNL